MADPTDSPAACCDCGCPPLPGKRRCGVCQMRQEAQADVVAALTPLPPLMPQYSLATLFFSVTWIAICLGSLKLSPCLGMLLIFLTMPALLRTLALGLRDREAGVPVRPRKRLVTFLASLAIMLVVLIVSGSIFAAAGWLVLTTAKGPPFPDAIQTAVALIAMTFGVFAAFAAAAAILWYTRWLGA